MATLGYLQFPSGPGNKYLRTDDKPQLDITGSLDLIVCLNVQVDQTIGLVDKFGFGGTNTGYRWLYNPNSSSQFAYGTGTNSVFEMPSINVEDLDTDHWLRVTFDAANGNRVWYYSSDPPDTDVGEVSWTQIASEPGGGATSIAASDFPLYVNEVDGMFGPGGWRLYALWVYDGISTSGGTLVANPDFRAGTPDWSGGSASDGLGNTWTIAGNAVWIPPEASLLPPANLTAVAQSPSSILVSWDAVDNADAYDVERDSVIVAEKITETSYLDEGLAADTEYTYRVRSAVEIE